MVERNTRIRASQISDIRPADITAYATNVPADNNIPSYDEATGKWTWVTNTAGVTDLQGAFDGGQSITIADSANQTLALINNDTTNNPNTFNITNATTGYGLYFNQTGILASGKYALEIYSNAIQTSSSLIHFYQDNASANASLLFMENDGSGTGIIMNQNGNGIGISLSNSGTNHGLQITQTGVLGASKYGLYIYSNAIQNTSALAKFYQDNLNSTRDVLQIQNDGSGASLYIAGTGANIYLAERADAGADKSGFGQIWINTATPNQLYFTDDAGADIQITGAGSHIATTHDYAYITGNDGATDITALELEELTDASETTLHSHAVTATPNLQQVFDEGQAIVIADSDNQTLALTQNDTTNNPDAMQITNAGTGDALQIAQIGNGRGILLSNNGTNHGIAIDQSGVLATGKRSLNIYSNIAHVNADSALVKINQDHALSTEPALEIKNDGSGAAIEIHGNTSGGWITNDSQPAFLVLAGSQTNIPITTPQTLVMNSEQFDQGEDYNTSTYTFTAPVTGKYQFNISIVFIQVDSACTNAQVSLVTSNRTYYIGRVEPNDVLGADSRWTFAGSVLADMDISDTAYLQVTFAGGAAQADLQTTVNTHWSGYLVF